MKDANRVYGRILRALVIAACLLGIAHMARVGYTGQATARHAGQRFHYHLHATFSYAKLSQKPDAVTVELEQWNGAAFASRGYINSPPFVITNESCVVDLQHRSVGSAGTFRWKITLWHNTTPLHHVYSNNITFS